MRKFLSTFIALSVFLGAGILVKHSGAAAEPAEPDYDKISQEADRNRELLEIWKEHVKSLTKERDDAYQELEQMRLSSPGTVARFGGVESAPLPSPAATQQIEGLQSEVSRLQAELERKTVGDPSREMQMQFSALQRQLQQVKKELNESRSEKDRLIQEKEKALSKAERLETEVASLQSQEGRPEPASGQELSSGVRDEGVFARQARELQYENETLKAHIAKLEVVEKELANTRGYFTPLVKDLQEKNDRLSQENDSLRSESSRFKDESSNVKGQINAARLEAQKYQKEADRLSADLEVLKTQSQRTEADLRTAQSEREQAASEIDSYKSQLQLASADRERNKTLEQQYRELKDQNETLQRAYAVLEENSGSSEGRMRELNAQMTAIQNDNRSLASREAGHLKEIERYKAALSANLADMKNLKNNFEAYLESLVASFEERQK